MRTRYSYKDEHAFPLYEQTTCAPVTPQRLQQAIAKATSHFLKHHREYQRVFRQYACRKLRCKKSAVAFCPVVESLRRIRHAQLAACHDCYGWTNGINIFISSDVPMAHDMLVGTLVHEELHCFARARGRYLGQETEHHCMRVLGECC